MTVIVLTLVAPILMGRISDGRWPIRLAIAMGTGATMIPVGGWRAGLWLVLAVAASDWAVRGRAPLPGLPRSDLATLPGVVVLAALAAWRGRGPAIGSAPLALVAGELALTGIGHAVGARLAALARGVGRIIGRLTSRIVFVALGLPLVALPWGLQRAFWLDPLAAPTTSSSSWLEVSGVDPWPERPWRADAARRRLGAWTRWRRVLALPVVVALVGVVVLTVGGGQSGAVGTAPRLAAVAHDPWWPELWRETTGIFYGGFDPRQHPRFKDLTSRYINIVDGNRVSWTPPACACRRLTVWIYGGSTVFGIGQRDDHTIASDLARIAAEHGLTLDVVNRGVPGDQQWIEAQRFSWDVVVDPRPDLVLFYDGVNELQASSFRNSQGHGDDESLVDLQLERLDVLNTSISPVPGIRIHTSATRPPLGPRALARHAVDRYEKSRKISEDAAAANGLPVVWFWQPSRLSRPEVAGEPKDRRTDERRLREYYHAATQRLPTEVIDLSDALDSSSAPMFIDDFHTNELGADLVARDLFRHVQARLTALAQG